MRQTSNSRWLPLKRLKERFSYSLQWWLFRRIRTKTNNASSDPLVDGCAKSEALSGYVLRFNSAVRRSALACPNQTQRAVATVRVVLHLHDLSRQVSVARPAAVPPQACITAEVNVVPAS